MDIDRSAEVDGCSPNLQPPDCAIDVAVTCLPCNGDCIDFFLCTDAGWEDVAYCTDDGSLVVTLPSGGGGA